MTYEEIDQLLKNHTSVRLMKADNAPLIISFLFYAFKEDVPTYKIMLDKCIRKPRRNI